MPVGEVFWLIFCNAILIWWSLIYFLFSDRELSEVESGEQCYENQVIWIQPANILRKKSPNTEFFWHVFSPNMGKYGLEELRIWRLFMQWYTLNVINTTRAVFEPFSKFTLKTPEWRYWSIPGWYSEPF